MKKLCKVTLLTAIFTFFICISSYAAEDVSVQTQLVDGLFSNIESADGTSYNISVDATKLISLLSSPQTGDVLSNDLYIKLPEGATKATVTYADTTKSSLNIATTSETNYAICPVPVLKKINNTYFPAFLNNLKENNTLTNSGTVEFFAEDDTSVSTITFSAKLDTNTFTGALVYLDSTSSDAYTLEKSSGDITNSASYDRIMANGDCTIHVLLSSNIGENITLEPFGTLTYTGTSDKHSVYTHEYSAQLTDKTILNNNILCMFSSAGNNILHVAELNFSGDLVTDNEQVPGEDEEIPVPEPDAPALSITDSTSNVKLDTTTAIVPEDTSLKVEVVTEGEKFDKIKGILGTDKLSIFSITLMSNDAAVQPKGNVKLSLPIPDNFNKDNLIAYRIDEDGTKTDYSVKVEGNYAVIETNHFSDYVLTEKADSTNESSDSNANLDTEPKTGIDNPVQFVLTVLVVACLGLTVCIKKMSK